MELCYNTDVVGHVFHYRQNLDIRHICLNWALASAARYPNASYSTRQGLFAVLN